MANISGRKLIKVSHLEMDFVNGETKDRDRTTMTKIALFVIKLHRMFAQQIKLHLLDVCLRVVNSELQSNKRPSQRQNSKLFYCMERVHVFHLWADFIYFLCWMSNIKMRSKKVETRNGLSIRGPSVCAITLLHIYRNRAARNPLESENDGK